jgi:hypothetical protein
MDLSRQDHLHQRMTSFFEKKGLSPKQQEAAVEMLDEFGSSVMDIIAVGKERGLTFKEKSDLIADLSAETVSQLSGVAGSGLGQEIMDRWYSLALQSTIVAEAQNECVAVGVPMSSEQMDTLALMLYKAKIDTPSSQPVSAAVYNFVTAGDGAVIAATASILKPQQIPLVKKALAHRLPIAGTP